MSLPREVLRHFLGRRADKKALPNISDADSRASVEIGMALLEHLGLLDRADGKHRIAPPERSGKSSGNIFEEQLASYLRKELGRSRRRFTVERNRQVWDFEQYAHLAVLQRLIADDPTGTLRQSIGSDYHVKPDITVGLEADTPAQILHATVSCKLTIRSDRAQNVRLEAATLLRHRRGRAPHIVAVTAEPLPSRLEALAMGTGDIDALYHVALPELRVAVDSVSPEQSERLEVLVGQRRLLDASELPNHLTSY